MKTMKWLQHTSRDRFALYFPLVLLILFFAGYLFVGILGKPDLVIGGILFGGSLFVLIIVRLLHFVVARVNRDEELQEALDAAQRASQAKTIFLSNMSHDIRTPMNAIIGYTQLARREGVGEEEMRTFLGKIDDSSQYLLALINDVLEMSRIESGKMDLEPFDVDLLCILQNIRDMFTEQMEQKQIAFTVEHENLDDRYVTCDPHRLNRILMNLLSNAYKFTPEGGEVTVTLAQTGRTEIPAQDADENAAVAGIYELRVRDNGIGMHPEFAKHIFEAFERERNTTDSGIQGTGLGMSITKSIVDLMGGTISLETEPGRGTEFTVRLTFPVVSDLTNVRTCHEVQEIEAQHVSFDGKRLLLVEDNEVNREIAMMILEEKGFLLDVAENGQIAVNRIRDTEPAYYDAILMDIQMPVMNGYEASQAIRSLNVPGSADIPIIAMTANAFQEDIRMEREAGIDAHITKPIDVRELMQTLTEVLERGI
ncbi:MAG: response regulator [Eubacterium sp.]|nr:response regulator [Eubacterium sp.]